MVASELIPPDEHPDDDFAFAETMSPRASVPAKLAVQGHAVQPVLAATVVTLSLSTWLALKRSTKIVAPGIAVPLMPFSPFFTGTLMMGLGVTPDWKPAQPMHRLLSEVGH